MKPGSFILRIFESKEQKKARITTELDDINRRINRVRGGISAEPLADLEAQKTLLETRLLKLGHQ